MSPFRPFVVIASVETAYIADGSKRNNRTLRVWAQTSNGGGVISSHTHKLSTVNGRQHSFTMKFDMAVEPEVLLISLLLQI